MRVVILACKTYEQSRTHLLIVPGAVLVLAEVLGVGVGEAGLEPLCEPGFDV